MSKNKKKNTTNALIPAPKYIDDEGFYRLVPKQDLTAGSDLLFSKKPKKQVVPVDIYDHMDDDEENGDDEFDSLSPDDKIAVLFEIIDSQAQVIEALKATLEVSDEMMLQICKSAGLEDDELDDLVGISEHKPVKKKSFIHVNGMDIKDFDIRKFLPNWIRDIDGINLDYKPGRGFSISPHYRSETVHA